MENHPPFLLWQQLLSESPSVFTTLLLCTNNRDAYACPLCFRGLHSITNVKFPSRFCQPLPQVIYLLNITFEGYNPLYDSQCLHQDVSFVLPDTANCFCGVLWQLPSCVSVGCIRTPTCANTDLVVCLYTHAQEVSTWDTSSSAVDAVLRRASLTHWWRQWCKCTTVNQNNKRWKGLHSLGMIILYLRKSSLFFYWYQKIKKKKKSSGSRTGVACQHTVQGLGLSRQQLVINVVRCLLHFGFCGEKKKSLWSLEIWSRTSGTQVLSILRLNTEHRVDF